MLGMMAVFSAVSDLMHSLAVSEQRMILAYFIAAFITFSTV